MEAGRYFETNPGHWNQMDRLTREILFLDLSSASWLNMTLSGAPGRMNSRVDTVITFPHFAKTNRLYSCQNYPHIPKSQHPKEDTTEERHLSTHYELQKSVPVETSPEDEVSWARPFEPSFFVQVGQRGQNPIDTDFIARLSRKSRIKMATTSSDGSLRRRVNNVSISYQLDLPKLSYEMGFSTANEIFARLVQRLTPMLSVASELYSKHYPVPKGSTHKSITHSHLSFAARLTNVTRADTLEGPASIPPFEVTAMSTLGHYYGISASIQPLKDRLALAVSWKRRWLSPSQKLAVGARLSFSYQDMPSFLKLTLSTHAGVAAFLGCRLSELGLGVGVAVNPYTSRAQAALFFDI